MTKDELQALMNQINKYYKLEGQRVVPCTDVIDWARSFDDTERQLFLTDIGMGQQVSTVFSGLPALNFLSPGVPPRVFETMIFGGPHHGARWNWATWEEAEVGHKRIVTQLENGENPEEEEENDDGVGE